MKNKNWQNLEKRESKNFQSFLKGLEVSDIDEAMLTEIDTIKNNINEDLINQCRQYMTEALLDNYIAWQLKEKDLNKSDLKDFQERLEKIKNKFRKQITGLKVTASLGAKWYVENNVTEHDQNRKKPEKVLDENDKIVKLSQKSADETSQWWVDKAA